MITHTKLGGRTVELFVPFKFKGKKVTKVAFGPPTLGHTFSWQAGEYLDALELMADLAGMEREAIRAIPYPDADRVMQVFLEMLPMEIRDSIGKVSSGEASSKPESVERPPEPEPATPPQSGDQPQEPPHPYVMGEVPAPSANPLGLDLDVRH